VDTAAVAGVVGGVEDALLGLRVVGAGNTELGDLLDDPRDAAEMAALQIDAPEGDIP
jgi:hypothetical protein